MRRRKRFGKGLRVYDAEGVRAEGSVRLETTIPVASGLFKIDFLSILLSCHCAISTRFIIHNDNDSHLIEIF